MARKNPEPYVLQPGEGAAMWGADGALTLFKATGDLTGERLAIIEDQAPRVLRAGGRAGDRDRGRPVGSRACRDVRPRSGRGAARVSRCLGDGAVPDHHHTPSRALLRGDEHAGDVARDARVRPDGHGEDRDRVRGVRRRDPGAAALRVMSSRQARPRRTSQSMPSMVWASTASAAPVVSMAGMSWRSIGKSCSGSSSSSSWSTGTQSSAR